MTNILSNHERHKRYCTQPILGSRFERGDVGDVRKCEHGKIMLAYEVLGTIPPYWRTLDPAFTPFLYWRARRALNPYKQEIRRTEWMKRR